MKSLHWSFRTAYLSGFLICTGLIAFVLYAQYWMLMDPCPLCILQRVAFIALGVVFLVGGLHAPRGGERWAYTILVLAAVAVGVGIAARQLWIQSLPPGSGPSCGAPLGYLLETRQAHGGLFGVLNMVLSGSGECAKVSNIFGLPMSLWSLIWFVLLGVGGLFAVRSRR